MPSEAENINYLYLVLTNDGSPVINWDAVSAALELNKGAVTKRWSRLKQSMDRNEVPGGTTYQFLWLCVKHHKRTQPPNWSDIAAKANTTSGAASKRYSRMKKVFEDNDTVPDAGTPRPSVKNTRAKAKATPKSPVKKPRKVTTSSSDDQDDVQTTPVSKRKRALPKKKVAATDEEAEIEPEPDNEGEDEDELLDTKPKRAKAGKNKIKVIPKPKPKDIVKKEDTDGDGEDSFVDAQESLDHQEDAREFHHDSYVVHDPEPADSLGFSDDFI
ncbi:hypothetical protein J4E91_003658 [Alternaria rosae]|nr:hypothetical protein J4E91_003658 [Alternaria rosae]